MLFCADSRTYAVVSVVEMQICIVILRLGSTDPVALQQRGDRQRYSVQRAEHIPAVSAAGMLRYSAQRAEHIPAVSAAGMLRYSVQRAEHIPHSCGSVDVIQ